MIFGVEWWVLLLLGVFFLIAHMSVAVYDHIYVFATVCLSFVVIDISKISNILLNTEIVLLISAAYVLVGAIWATIKWYFYTKRWYEKQIPLIEKNRHVFLKRINISNENQSIPEQYKKLWNAWLDDSPSYTLKTLEGYNDAIGSRPHELQSKNEIRTRKNLNKISIWFIWWPISMMGDAIENTMMVFLKLFFKGFLYFENKILSDLEKKINE
jgi:hypothetical protein